MTQSGGPTENETAPAERDGYRRRGLLSRSGHMEYDRILFFSDAVFAIAVTLLVVDLPSRLIQKATSGSTKAIDVTTVLHHANSGIEGFAISFAVIALYWVGHHGLFRYITAIDRPLLLLNLLFLGFIAFLPYPTALLSAATSQTAAVVFYAAIAGTAGLLEALMWLYAVRSPAGLTQDVTPVISRLVLLRCGRVPAVFGISIVIAIFSPTDAQVFWVMIAISGLAINHWYGGHEHQPGRTPPDPTPADPNEA